MAEHRDAPDAGDSPDKSVDPMSVSHSSSAVRVSLRVKFIALFVVVGLFPAALAIGLLATFSRDAVETTEKQLQAAVVADVTRTVVEGVRQVQEDSSVMAAMLSVVAAHPQAGAGSDMQGLRAMLATRKAIDSIRFEVPAAGVSTVISTDKANGAPPPKSTKAQRDKADVRGVSFDMMAGGRGVVVVPVPQMVKGGASGYVVTWFSAKSLQTKAERIVQTRLAEGKANLLVVDATRRAVASVGLPNMKPGGNTADFEFWKALPASTAWNQHLAVVGPMRWHGASMISDVETVPELGWVVALWRPRPVAYRALTDLANRSFMVAAGALLLALLAGVFAGRALSQPIVELMKQAKLIGKRAWGKIEIDTSRRDELGQLAVAMGQMATDLRQGEHDIRDETRKRTELSRFLSKELVDQVLKGQVPLVLGGKRAEVTVLFADVVAFTPFAESHEPEVVVKWLNEMLSILSEVVFRHGGMVDKYLGDSVMAVWGALQPQDDHASLALAAAEDMMRFLDAANETWGDQYEMHVQIAIGVNSGTVIAGNVGSRKRMEYTVVGDVVNVASRLESVARPNQVLVGEATARGCEDKFELIPLGKRSLFGKKEGIEVYELSV